MRTNESQRGTVGIICLGMGGESTICALSLLLNWFKSSYKRESRLTLYVLNNLNMLNVGIYIEFKLFFNT